MKNPRNAYPQTGLRHDAAVAQKALEPQTIRMGHPEEDEDGKDGWMAFQSLSMLVGLMVVGAYLFFT